QLVAVATDVLGAGADRVAVPLSISRVRTWDRPGRRVWVHAVRRGDGATGPTGDALLLDDEGRALVALEGVELRQLDRGASPPAPAGEVDDCLSAVDWEGRPLPAAPGSRAALAAPGAVAATVAPHLERGPGASARAEYYAAVEPRLSGLAALAASVALAAIGHP